MREQSRTRQWAFLIFLFLLALLPHVVQPVSRPLVWYLRSVHFIEDVLAGNWAKTVSRNTQA